MKPIRASLAALLAIASAAQAFEPAYKLDGTLPVMTVQTEHHGTITFDYSGDGQLYSLRTLVPYTARYVCSTSLFDSRENCRSEQGSVLDGVIVTRTDSERCMLEEHTLKQVDVRRTPGGKSAVQRPDVQIRDYVLPCTYGLR